MKKIMLGAVALIAIGAAPALAADLPVYTKAPPPEVVYNWTGFYIGGNLGWAGERVSNNYLAPGPGAPGFIAQDQAVISADSSNSFRSSNVTFGAEAGYNYQFNRIGLIGGEIDINRLGFRDSANVVFPTPFAGPVNSSTSNSMGWLATARARVGVILKDRLLVYGTGGVAVVNRGFSETNVFNPVLSNAGVDTINLGQTQVGWTAGAGVEYAITDNWSVKGEYLHVGLPNLNGVSTTSSPFFGNPAIVSYSHSVDGSIDIVRVGLNYHFGGPLVAQY
jgi:outer membrane immunogenic protein